MCGSPSWWSPVNDFVALAYGGRHMAGCDWSSPQPHWTSWDFTLPDGGPIPEYTFLPEDWGSGWTQHPAGDN